MSQQQPQKQQKSSGAQQQRKEIRIQALVKKVLSGDTIVLVHPAKPQQEKTVSFSNVQAPKLARKDDETEEPFAFEAREFVRRKCIGKLAEFVLEFTSDKGRDFGTLFLDESKENLTLSLLQEGLATTKKNVKDQDEYKPLKAAEEAAKNAKRGVHADEKVKAQNTRQLKKAVANAVYEQYKNKPTNMVVEAVLSGTTIRILTPTNDNILMHLTGVHSPDHVRIESKEEKKPSPPKNVVEAKDDKKDDKKKDEKKKEQSGHKIPQPFAAEAKLFTETRLLQRDVTVIIEGVDGDAVIGTILKGNSANATTFQEELLSKGLSKIAPWNVQKSKFQPRLKMAEDDAKRQKLRYWQFETREPAQPKKSSLNESDKLEFTARVIEILNADSIRVRNEKTGEEERIALSSIRAQRLARRPPPKKRGEKKPADAPVDKSKKSADPAASAEEIQHEPYALEARELVRARLAGKHVTIRVDYRREMGAPKKDDKKNANKPQVEQPAAQQGAQETRRFCTVLSENKNVALELVQAGYATVIHHRFGEERSPFFSQLVAAENEAQAAKKGIHGSKKNFPVYHINDLSSKTLGQVQQYLKMFKDTKKKAAVEKLFSPTRMKLSLFKDAMVINFAVLGVGTPAAARGKDGQAKPFSKEALQFAIDSLLMRDVEIEVLEMDKTGSFAGQLFVNGQNFSEALLKQGLGFIVPKAAAKLKNQQALQDIEREAKNSKKGVWGVENFFEKKKRDENKPQRKLIVKTPQDTPFTVRLTEIVNATSFYYQTAASAEALEKLEEAMAALGLDAQAPATEAKEGELVFAKFSVDGAWYRGKALKHSKEGKVKVQFIDFGNTEEVALADVRSAVPDAIKQVPAQAQLANLAFTYYADSQYQEALSFTREFADGRDIIAQFEFEDDNGKSVSLIDPVDKASLATLLVQNGLALVDKPYHISKNPLFKAVIDELLKELGAAKTDRVGTWENGDVEDEEDDE